MFCFSIPGRDGAIPGQSHMARGGMAGCVVNISISINIYLSLIVDVLSLLRQTSQEQPVLSVRTVSFFLNSRGGYMNTGTSQSLSGALNRQNQLMQGGGLQGGAFGRRY